MVDLLNPAAPRIKGADVSSLLEIEANGGVFSDTAKAPGGSRSGSQTEADEDLSRQKDALGILKDHGFNLIRLRLWNDPYSESGEPYGGGTNDLPRTIRMARRCKALGLPWLLDFHYSDFWADPGRQIPPKAWAGLDAAGMEKAVYAFTLAVLRQLESQDLTPAAVSVGNELSNGLLWPLGQVPNWSNIARFISAGIRAVRAADPGIPVMIHLDNGSWYGMHRSWIDSYLINGGVNFDCIGLSWYPFWNGKMEALRDNLTKLAGSYGKPMLVAGTAMAFTLDESRGREDPAPDRKNSLAVNEKTAADVDYPISPEGQSRFLKDLWETIRSVPKDLCRGFIWQEPAWLPVPGVDWAGPEGLRYLREEGPGVNQRANQCLFDYDGAALPALHTAGELR